MLVSRRIQYKQQIIQKYETSENKVLYREEKGETELKAEIKGEV